MGLMAAKMPTACGPDKQKFNVTLDDKQHDVGAPGAGKALVVFVQDLGAKQQSPFVDPVTRIGINGSWVGANMNAAWFAVSVEPGPAHLCASAQGVMMHDVVELLSFTAVEGQIYYFRVRDLAFESRRLEFAETNEDQGRWMAENLPRAAGNVKK